MQTNARVYGPRSNMSPAILRDLLKIAAVEGGKRAARAIMGGSPAGGGGGGGGYGSKARSRVNNASQMASNYDAAPAISKKNKKKSRKKRRKPSKSASFKKKVKRIIYDTKAKVPKQLVRDYQDTTLGQVFNAINKVDWSYLELRDKDDWNPRCEFRQVGLNGDATERRVEIIADETAAGALLRSNRTFYFNDYFQYHFKNNTNSTAEMTIYVLKCIDITSSDPLTELAELRKAAFSDTGVVALDDDFSQYWSVKSVPATSRKWAIHEKVCIELSGGRESRVHLQMPKFRYNRDQHFEQGNATYVKGQYLIVCRIQGKPTHGIANPGQQAMTNTLVDYARYRTLKTYVKNDTVVQVYKDAGNFGFNTIADPVVAAPEAVELEGFDDG